MSTGTYTVTVTDANGCTAMTVATITQPSAILLSGSINGNNIDITVTGGIPGYTYSWSNGAITQDLTNLSPGTYTVTVTDANNCMVTASYTIQNQNPPLSVTSAISPVLCAGGQDGSIIVTVAGGNGPYNVSWTGPVSGNPAGNEIANSGGSYLIANLPAGIYSVTVTDANGTLDIIQLVITQPTPIVTSYNIASVTCYGGNDGSIFLTISGGVPSYYLQWSNGSNSQNLSNLSAGVYNFIITDANNCTMQGSINITQPPLLTITGTTSNNNIDISISGGTAPYVYLWSNGATTQDVTNLSPGTYTVTVIDANNCTVTALYTVLNQNPALSVTSAISPVLCAGGQDGSIIVTAAGGNAPYNVSWTGPVVGNPAGNEIANSGGSYLIANMPAGTYTLTITDSNGNSTNISATITQPQSPLTLLTITTNNLCFGAQTGAIDLTVSGGTGPYTYLWSNGITLQDPQNLGAGIYSVTVTDANGCTVQLSATITQPQAPLTASSTQVNVLCHGSSTGSIDVSVSGGTSPYTYTWSNGVVGQDLVNIPSGTFSLTVTDANACTATTSATITQPSALLLTGSVNGNNIDISVSGGTVPYNYSWSSGDVTQDLANVSSGTYSVTVTDAFNCSITDTFIVNNAGLEQQESIELQVFPNPAQDMVTIRSSSAGIGNTYRMLDCYGRNVLEGTLSSQETIINIQTLANGIYHVKCGSETRALVISH
ncbi:MAG: T9SS type A sorting domain-containing protein [Crocinitomicaceae bacterium]|nr:T9SS type A sorting domain-containing protein [Crocinitomicaceae bacterium]